MTLVIDMSPAMQQRLADAARRRGVDPVEYVKQLINAHVPLAGASQPEPIDVDQILDEFFRDNPEAIAPLPPSFSRADIYSDHD
jgi:hypothetical protein